MVTTVNISVNDVAESGCVGFHSHASQYIIQVLDIAHAKHF